MITWSIVSLEIWKHKTHTFTLDRNTFTALYTSRVIAMFYSRELVRITNADSGIATTSDENISWCVQRSNNWLLTRTIVTFVKGAETWIFYLSKKYGSWIFDLERKGAHEFWMHKSVRMIIQLIQMDVRLVENHFMHLITKLDFNDNWCCFRNAESLLDLRFFRKV